MENTDTQADSTSSLQNRSPEIAKLAGALSKAQSAITGASKDTANKFLGNSYASLASVWEACRKPLTDNNLAVIQLPGKDSGGLFVDTVLSHESGEFIACRLRLTPGYTSKSGEFVELHDPQAIGSAITYARRYGLSAIAGIAPDDDDGEAASRHGVRVETAPVQRPSREPARAQRATSAQQGAPETWTGGREVAEKAAAEEKAFADDQLPGLTTWRDVVVHPKSSLQNRKLGDLQLSQLKVIRDCWIERIDWSSTNPIYYTKQDLHLKAAVLMGISELEKPAEAPAEIKPTREYLLGKLRELMAEATMSGIEIMSHLKKGKQCAEDATSLNDIPDDDLELYISEWPKLLEAWGAVPAKKKGAKK